MTHQERNCLDIVTIKWMKLCVDFLLTNVMELGKPYFTEWTFFPPVYRERTLSSVTSGGSITIGYNSFLHVNFILTTTMDSDHDFINRILIFHAAERVLLNVRATSSTNVHILYATWSDCSQDITYLIYINGKRYFIDSDTILLGALNLEKEKISKNICLECNPF